MKPALLGVALALLCSCARFAPPQQAGPAEEGALVDDVWVRATTVGEGPDLLLIHGFASSMSAWAGVRDDLCAGRRCTLLDLPGFGESGKPDRRYGPTHLATVVDALMTARGIERADVVAHSWGCSVALALALERPDRIRRLVLTSPWVYVDQFPTFLWWARHEGLGELLFALFYEQQIEARVAAGFAHPERHVTDELLAAVDHALARPGAQRAALQAVRDMRLEALSPRYGGVRTPAQVIWGAADRVSPGDVGRRLAATLQRAETASIADCGHLPMVECGPAFVHRVKGFLDRPAPEEP